METQPPFLNGDPEFLAKEAQKNKEASLAGLELIRLARERALEREAEEAEEIKKLTTNELPATAEQYKNAKEGKEPLAELTSNATKPKPKEPWWLK